MYRLPARWSVIFLLLLAVCACAPVNAPPPPRTPDREAAPQAEPTRQQPLPTATPNAPLRLRFWLPDALAGLENVAAGDVLSEQISSFENSEASLTVELRLRASEGGGGILATLRTAAQVAPSALPDITLMRYADFRTAVQLGLIAPLDISELIVDVDDYYPPVAEMGQVDGRWYGVPGTLDVLHVAYAGDEPAVDAWRFDDLMANEVPLVFPAASGSGLSPVFWVQYAAGSRTQSLNVSLDENALRVVLRYYEDAVNAGLIPPTVLEYDAPERYPDVLDDSVAAVVTSSMYLQFLGRGTRLETGYIPTAEGLPMTALDGWLWVIVSNNSEQQAAALRFLNWMLTPERQAAYHDAIRMLPAARAGQRQIDAEYAAFLEPLLENAILPPSEITGGTSARALQTAFVSVINGRSTAADALTTVIEQLGG